MPLKKVLKTTMVASLYVGPYTPAIFIVVTGSDSIKQGCITNISIIRYTVLIILTIAVVSKFQYSKQYAAKLQFLHLY